MAQSGVEREGDEVSDPLLSCCLECKAIVVLPPTKSERERKDLDSFFPLTLSHRSPRSPEQLASFFPGN